MARYRQRSRAQSMMVPVCFEDQIQPGTFEYAVDYLVDNEINLSGFESRHTNDETGALSDPSGCSFEDRVVRLFPRDREQSPDRTSLRRERGVHGCLSPDTRPHFTTIAQVHQHHGRASGEGIHQCADGLLRRWADRESDVCESTDARSAQTARRNGAEIGRSWRRRRSESSSRYGS